MTAEGRTAMRPQENGGCPRFPSGEWLKLGAMNRAPTGRRGVTVVGRRMTRPPLDSATTRRMTTTPVTLRERSEVAGSMVVPSAAVDSATTRRMTTTPVTLRERSEVAGSILVPPPALDSATTRRMIKTPGFCDYAQNDGGVAGISLSTSRILLSSKKAAEDKR